MPTAMDLRYDRVARSAGLVRSMKTYTLVFADGFLYLLVTGPAGRILNPHSIPADLPPVPAQVAEAEARIMPATLDSLSGAKHCYKIAPREIARVRLDHNLYRLPRLRLQTRQGAFRFEFRAHRLAEVEGLVLALEQSLC